MPWAEVGGGAQRATFSASTDTGSGALAFPAPVAVGSLLCVAGACWDSVAAPASVTVTDSLGTSYTVVLGTVIGSERTWIAYGVAPSSGANTVTVNPADMGGTRTLSFSIDEFSGPDASPASVNGGTTTGTSTAPADSITTAGPDELILGVMTHDGSTMTLTPNGAYTPIGESEDNDGDQCHSAVFRVATTAQAYSVAWTTGSSTLWAAQTHSFTPATGGGGGAKPWPYYAQHMSA